MFQRDIYAQYGIQAMSAAGNAVAVSKLLRVPNVDPTYRNITVLHLAAEVDHIDVVQLLQNDGRADHAHADNLPLRIAAMRGFTDLAVLLVADPRVIVADEDSQALIHGNRTSRSPRL
jgi:ankyrin repeat protein